MSKKKKRRLFFEMYTYKSHHKINKKAVEKNSANVIFTHIFWTIRGTPSAQIWEE